MKDHEIAELVNQLTKIAREYSATQQLRSRISGVVCDAVKQPSESPMIWARLAKEAKSCQRTWGMGFPVISTSLLREYWHEATGFLPSDD